MQYWAIVCVTCATLHKLGDLPEDIQKSIRTEYYLPPVEVTGEAFDASKVITQEKSSKKFEITAEQKVCIDAVRHHKKIAIQALAGTGKTTTLVLIAKEYELKTIQYIAFNKSIVADVKSKMPGNVDSHTAHALAFRAVGNKYKDRLSSPGIKQYREMAREFEFTRFQLKIDDQICTYSAPQIAQLARISLGNFTKSTDKSLSLAHVLPAIHSRITSESGRKEISEFVLPLAERLWDDVLKIDGKLKFEHDFYLKMWQLSNPVIRKDLILFDEAQDADPVMIDIIKQQVNSQLVFCGDSFQQIYEWRGAKDALQAIDFDKETWLTKSFRFGDAIASEANFVLENLSPDVRVSGNEEIKSTTNPAIRPNVILSRTNAGLMSNIILNQGLGYKVATTVESSYLVNFFKECELLKQNRDVTHPELSSFSSWSELEEWATNFPTEAGELLSMVRLVNKFGTAQLIKALGDCTDESEANIVATTAHRAKGREWNNVKIDSDFPHISDMTEEDLRLIYVALTRAKLNLDASEWEAVEPKPNREIMNLVNVSGLPIPRFEPIPKAKPRRRDV